MKYDRQIGIIGKDGQKKLGDAHVAVAGCGGLGSTVITQLAMAGIGKFTIIDFDTIDETDMNRQFIHSNKKGLKTESAKEWTAGLSDCEIEIMSERLDGKNVMRFIGDSDIVVDCLDNNESRLVLNDGIIKKNVPLVHGGTDSMNGQVTFVIPGKTPCLACFLGKDSSENTSLGAAVSLIGSIQAAETIKFLTGRGDVLAGKLLSIDISRNDYDIAEIKRNPKCKKCSML